MSLWLEIRLIGSNLSKTLNDLVFATNFQSATDHYTDILQGVKQVYIFKVTEFNEALFCTTDKWNMQEKAKLQSQTPY